MVNWKAYRFQLMLVAVFVCLAGLSCSPNAKIRRLMREHRNRPDLAPSIGAEAPGFRLKTVDGQREVELASFRGKKPVVLVFGSYT